MVLRTWDTYTYVPTFAYIGIRDYSTIISTGGKRPVCYMIFFVHSESQLKYQQNSLHFRNCLVSSLYITINGQQYPSPGTDITNFDAKPPEALEGKAAYFRFLRMAQGNKDFTDLGISYDQWCGGMTLFCIQLDHNELRPEVGVLPQTIGASQLNIKFLKPTEHIYNCHVYSVYYDCVSLSGDGLVELSYVPASMG